MTTISRIDEYQNFLAGKAKTFVGDGIEVALEDLHPSLFPFQRDLTRWSLRKGRSALLLDTGLGKSYCALAWSEHIPGRVLTLAPLSVAQQTVAIAKSIDVPLVYARNEQQTNGQRNVITNYEMLPHFDVASYTGIIVDEASIMKQFDGVTTNRLITAFANTPYRLCCTATPAPNDVQEFGNYAEFLGIMSRTEMLATFFIHDQDHSGTTWRLKKHGKQPFYRWLASWAMSVGLPSDLGYDDNDFILPPLTVRPVVIPTEYTPDGHLLPLQYVRGITDRTRVRSETKNERIIRAADLIRAEPSHQWIAWCGLNAEQDGLAALLGNDCVSVHGSLALEEKELRLQQFLSGQRRVLITKAKIAGHGLNLQNSTRQVFVGINDSAEQYYQCLRRSWRFGQKQPVSAYVVVSTPEEAVYDNVLRKERQMTEERRELIKHVQQYERSEIGMSIREQDEYAALKEMLLPSWLT